MSNTIEYTKPLPPGIYFLVRDMKIVYIGQSINPTTRIATHIDQGKVFDFAFHIPVSSNRLDMLEKRLISNFTPPLNHSYNPSRKDKFIAGVGTMKLIDESMIMPNGFEEFYNDMLFRHWIEFGGWGRVEGSTWGKVAFCDMPHWVQKGKRLSC